MKRTGVAVALAMAGIAVAPGAASAARVELKVLSSRADLVSGGDALVRVDLQRAADLRRLKVRLGSRDVTRRFARRADGTVTALLTGIPDRAVTLTASIPGGRGARLRLTGHPNGGPLISGPQVQPWKCAAGTVGATCDAPASYALKAWNGVSFVAYDPQRPPPNVARTTTSEGVTVPFVVRVETGYQDRDQYKIATLYDPAQPWEPWKPQKAWNRRLVFTHGGSCGTDHGSGAAPEVLKDKLLGKGFMVASTALNNLGHNCNPVVIAESELMARERAIEQYGPVRATLGNGCSGGSIAQLMIAHAYPGFYDGITVQCTFADLFTTGKHAVSGHLFLNLFGTGGIGAGGGQVYTPADQAAVNGGPLAIADDLVFDTAFWGAIDGTGGCKVAPAGMSRWSPSNTGGVRCGVLDLNQNVLGTGPTGYAAIPFDNVGVQYGLKALEAGTLSVAKFVDVNSRIGGLDKVTLTPTPERTAADAAALANAYRAGYMAVGNTLDQTAILEGRGSNEATAHVTYPTKVLDARLQQQFGTTANHVLWEGPVALLGGVDFADRMVLAMDRWVAAIQKDRSAASRAEKIRADKPADVVSHCELADGATLPAGACPALVRYYPSPTEVAGESRRNDILKCALKPLDRASYPVAFTDAQWAAMQRTFPTGVCDWTRPGVGQQATVPWLTFQDSRGRVVPGGRALGPAPRSRAFAPRPRVSGSSRRPRS